MIGKKYSFKLKIVLFYGKEKARRSRKLLIKVERGCRTEKKMENEAGLPMMNFEFVVFPLPGPKKKKKKKKDRVTKARDFS